jgi:glucose-1-phosphate adenylyltransferase
MKDTLTMIMAGGKGERLYPLTKDRAKPAVTFGGIYKIIDFTLSNCLNSNIRRIYLLTQYSSASLDKHIRLGWNIFNRELGEFVDNIPPQKMNVDWWYRGTADSIFQNLNILQRERPEYVLILSGDHIYKMDYQKMVRFHKAKKSALTIACVELDIEESDQMGILEVDEDYQVTAFREKPANPKPLPSDPTKALASMGIYVFTTEKLVREIIYDAKRDTQHDFGRNIIPRMLKRERVFAYNFKDENKRAVRYWRDVGNVDTYYEANMELLQEKPIFDLYDEAWPIRTYQEQAPPAKVLLAANMDTSSSIPTSDSLISNGCVINGGRVEHSILSPHVIVNSRALVEDSIILRGVTVGKGARIRQAIIDAGSHIPERYRIGHNLEEDRKKFTVTDAGIVVVPQGSIID